MKGLADYQRRLLDAVIGPSRPTEPSPAARRALEVYRRNVVMGAVKVLELALPTVGAVLGVRNMRWLAREHLDRRPPRSCDQLAFADALPETLGELRQLDELPFLADLARLDLLVTQARQRPNEAATAPCRARSVTTQYPVLPMWQAAKRGELDGWHDGATPSQTTVIYVWREGHEVKVGPAAAVA